MRIAIHNLYAAEEVAETEFSRRICRAASNLGWEAAGVGSSAEVKQFDPDFVLALHFRTPKLTKYPTYGSMVTPPAFFTHDEQFIKNILSFDGYLSTSDHITSWLKDILYTTEKKHFIAPFYTSCHSVPYREPKIRQPRLLYTGTNWDGPRFKELLQQLDAKPYMDIYGPKGAWTYLNHSYRGALPFDGSSLLDSLHSAGAGLCLHRQEHCAAAAASSRIFEIVASGAIAICQEHPFIREAFGNSVLYLDPAASIAQAAPQISEYMRWIEENQEEALQLSKRAYAIFSENYTLEKLLSNIGHCHKRLVTQKAFFAQTQRTTEDRKTVQYVVRVGDRGTDCVERALDSLVSQTEGRVSALIVRHGNVPGLIELLRQYANKLPVEIVDSPSSDSESAQLWVGLKAVSSEYFGILDYADVIHPNHVHSLLQLLEGSHSNRGVAYSGSIRIQEPPHAESDLESSGPLPSEPAELGYFEPFDLNRLVALDTFMTPNAFIARSSLLKDLGDDPHLPALEDLFLFLLLSRKADFVFSYEATCEVYGGSERNNSSSSQRLQSVLSASDRIKSILWKQSFSSTRNIGPSKLVQLEENQSRIERTLAQYEGLLAQLETALAQTNSKLDITATRLNRYLSSPLLDVIRRVRRALLRLPPPKTPGANK